jgi:hypothetical protein
LPSYPLPYVDFPVPATQAFPAGRVCRRPLITLRLRNGDKYLSCHAVVDSGADHCVFPRSFMQPLGIDPLVAPVEHIGGVGSNNVPTHFASVTMDFMVVQIPALVGFTMGMEQHGMGLLGQADFFEHFRVTFDHRNKLFIIEN